MQYVGTYLVRGDDATFDALMLLLRKEDIIKENSPDVYAKKYRSFGVEEAEDLRRRVRTKPVDLEQRVFVVLSAHATMEAQNALLKTLEEPTANTVLFIVTPSPETWLPTIRSRSQSLVVASHENASIIDADDFLAAAPEKRITMLKPLYDSEDEGRDIGAVVAFLQSLERRFAKAEKDANVRAGIHAIYRARKYVTDKGSLLKSLLEQVALLAPKL